MFYVSGMSICVSHSTARPAAQFHNVSLCSLVSIPTAPGDETRASGVPVGCASHYRVCCNEVSNVGTVEVGLHSKQVPNSCSRAQSTVDGANLSSISCYFLKLST